MCSWFAGTTTAFFFSSGDWVECTLTLANNGYFLHISLGFIVCHIAWFEIKTALRLITQTNVELSISACAPWYPASNPTLRYTCICPPHTHSFWGEETRKAEKGERGRRGKGQNEASSLRRQSTNAQSWAQTVLKRTKIFGFFGFINTIKRTNGKSVR